jgi:uncharacterized protein
MRLAPALILIMSLVAAGTTSLIAADTTTAKAELKASFATRAAQLAAAKAAGTIGETTDGLVAAVQAIPDGATAALIQAENADRTRLYLLLAGETNATPAQVGERNALRNYQNAAAGAWLRTRGGQWKQK